MLIVLPTKKNDILWKHLELHVQCTDRSFSFLAICKQSCMNGGICRKPGICACANGYTGPSCERDLDECTTNTHRCTSSSKCMNMIGWYYCTCRDGFKGPGSDNNLGTLCSGKKTFEPCFTYTPIIS